MASDNFVDYVKFTVLPAMEAEDQPISDVKNTFPKGVLMEVMAEEAGM